MEKKCVRFRIFVKCVYDNLIVSGEVAKFQKKKDALIYVGHLKTFSDIELLGYGTLSLKKVVIEIDKEKGYLFNSFFFITKAKLVHSKEILKGE